MTCAPARPCGPLQAELGVVPPGPGETAPERRLGDFSAFLRDLIETTEQRHPAGVPLGTSWDVEGDPNARLLAELWAFVADGVAAYTELIAREAYLPTASDWTDLRRLAALVGYRPRPRIAAQGWVRADVERGTNPIVPAGTRTQAPGTSERPSQTFEVAADTQLRSEWGGLTATWVPTPATPTGREVRFLGDPGFRLGDRVLFVEETPQGFVAPSTLNWFSFWGWLMNLVFSFVAASTKPLAVAGVEAREDELGTALVRFDRELDQLLTSATKAYSAYRIRATAGSARRLASVLRIPASGSATAVSLPAYAEDAISANHVVLDAALEDLSAGQLVAVVDWHGSRCDLVRVQAHRPIEWEVAPGTPTRCSRLEFDLDVPTLSAAAGPVTVYVVDRRVVARHYTFPTQKPAGAAQVRLYPKPAQAPPRIAVETTDSDGAPLLEVFECAQAAVQESPPSAPGSPPLGLIVDLLDGFPARLAREAPASGNLVRVRHGATARATLGSGDATLPNQRFRLPDAPVAYDLDAAGAPVPTQVLRVDGALWDELPSLYGAGPVPAFATTLEPDGAVTGHFGDGVQGARLPTGRNNVTAAYRVGGGTIGEVASGAIETLLGSVRGVKKVKGAGPTSGGADQDDERRIRELAPARARAFGRVVSIEDLVDLSLGYPGVTHAAAWAGAGPPGCPCGGSNLHVAFLREGTGGPRPPLAAEILSLSGYLETRRDTSLPLCVCAGAASQVSLTAIVAVEPRLEPAAVAAAVRAALVDPEGRLAPRARSLGEPLDRSDVIAVVHGVEGVVGVVSSSLGGASGPLGRRAAQRHELLVLAPTPVVQGVAA